MTSDRWSHFGSTISKLFQIDVLLMPNITLTSLLEIGLDLSYETGDLPRLVNLMQEKASPASCARRSRRTPARCW